MTGTRSVLEGSQVVPSRSPDADTGSARRLTLWFVLGAGALSAVLFWLAHASLIDDAYITLAYAKNLATDLHWGLTPQQVSNTATSPGNVLLLAGATAAVGVFGGVHPVIGLGVVSVGCGTAFGWAWARIVRRLDVSPAAGALGIVLVLLNPVLISAIGLEVLPTAAVLALLLAAALDGRPVLFGALAGAALLIRLDLVVFVVPLALASSGVRRRLHLAIPVAVAVGAPWYVWSWFYFGSAVPDTFVIKTLQRSFDGIGFADGPIAMFEGRPGLMFEGRPGLTVLAFAPALVGTVVVLGFALAAALRRAARFAGFGPVVALGVGGIAYYAVYAKLHVPPYHWYYVSPIIALTTTAVLGTAVLARRRGVLDRVAAIPLGVGLGAAALATVALVAAQGAPWTTTIIFGNWATSADYARVGTEIGDRVGDDVVINFGEIGTLAYFCECAMVNDFTDRGVLVPLVDRRIAESGPVGSWLLRLNYHNLNRTQTPLPADYELRYAPGPGAGPDVWQIFAPGGRGTGHLTLVPLR